METGSVVGGWEVRNVSPVEIEETGPAVRAIFPTKRFRVGEEKGLPVPWGGGFGGEKGVRTALAVWS